MSHWLKWYNFEQHWLLISVMQLNFIRNDRFWFDRFSAPKFPHRVHKFSNFFNVDPHSLWEFRCWKQKSGNIRKITSFIQNLGKISNSVFLIASIGTLIYRKYRHIAGRCQYKSASRDIPTTGGLSTVDSKLGYFLHLLMNCSIDSEMLPNLISDKKINITV